MFKSQRSPSASKVPKAYEYIKYNIGIGLDINFNFQLFSRKKKEKKNRTFSSSKFFKLIPNDKNASRQLSKLLFINNFVPCLNVFFAKRFSSSLYIYARSSLM